MFEGLKRFWKGFMRMFGYTTLKQIVGKDITLSDNMINAINQWKQMLNGQADWITDSIVSLGIEEGICREFADCVLVEMETNLSNERLDKIYQKNISSLNENLQEGLALGSFVLKPLGEATAEFISADKIIPISFGDDGKPNDIAFLTVKKVGDTNYFTRFERHYFINGNLTIENKCFHSQTASDIGLPCSLEAVEEWLNINPGPVTYPGMNRMDFGYYRNPIKNKVDGSACGVSVYDSATDLIKKADIQGARLDWEYESGERAIHVDGKALNADRDSKQYYRYKNILGDDVGSLADFRQMKYNEPKKFSALKKKVDTYSDIDKKEWSPEFKQKSKEAYVRFEKEGIYMSVHALSRLSRLNKPGYPSIEESDVLTIVRGNPNYSEGESKLIFFDLGKQLVVVKNKETDDIVSIVRRKMPKEVWERV